MTTADEPSDSLVKAPAKTRTPAAKAVKPRDTRREGEFCTCGMQLSLTRVCSNCD
jgi:hypothetical protein